MSSDSSDSDSPVERRSSRLLDPSFYPGRGRSLSGIAFRSFVLGTVLGLSLSVSALLLFYRNSYWRPTAVLAALALFHFLEFFVTARYNPPRARVSAFILSSNGHAYNVAQLASFGEFFVRRFSTSDYWWPSLTLPDKILGWRKELLPYQPYASAIGVFLMIVGQWVRTAAMAEAGKSFSHLVQYKKRDDHKLITSGVYSWLRHPSYFGYFWYVVGAQLVMGNPIGMFGLSYAIWKFFAFRIPSKS